VKWRSFANQPKSASIGITYLASSQLPSGWEVNSSALANSSGFNVGLIAAGTTQSTRNLPRSTTPVLLSLNS